MTIPEPAKEKDEKDSLRSILGTKYGKAKELGIDSLKRLAMYTPVKLIELGLYYDMDRASRVIREARLKVGRKIIHNKEDRRRYRELPKLSTGVKSLDQLFDGGLWPGKIYGVFGEQGAGKSRIAHQLCVTVQLPPINGKAIYMDSENVFEESIIAKTAERFEFDPDTVLDSILVVDSSDYFDLEEFLRRDWPGLLEEGFNLLVIDTFVGPYREGFPGRGHLAERQQRMNTTLSEIRKKIRFFNSYCYIADQMQSNPDPSKREEKTFVGGDIFGHGVTLWYGLSGISKDVREIYAYDIIHKRSGDSARFKITDYGLESLE